MRWKKVLDKKIPGHRMDGAAGGVGPALKATLSLRKKIMLLLQKMQLEELAARIGVSHATIYAWKSGRAKPSRLAKPRIEEVFKQVEGGAR